MSNTETYITIVGFSGKAALTAGANPIQAETLAILNGAPAEINSDEAATLASDALSVANKVIKAVGEMRLMGTRPLKEQIDAAIKLERDYLAPIIKERDVVLGRTNHYLLKRREEESRQQQEALEAQRKAQAAQDEAARQQQQAEALRQQAEQAKGAEATRLQAEADKLEDLALTQALQAESASMQIVIVEPVKIQGRTIRDKINYQVTDWRMLLEAFPRFFAWDKEKELAKVKRSDLKEFLNIENNQQLTYHEKTGLPVVPGLNCFREVKWHTR